MNARVLALLVAVGSGLFAVAMLPLGVVRFVTGLLLSPAQSSAVLVSLAMIVIGGWAASVAWRAFAGFRRNAEITDPRRL